MAKCKRQIMHWFVFEQGRHVENDYNAVSLDFDNPLNRLKRRGTYTTRIPTEFVQSNQVHGALGYDLEFPYDRELAAVTSDYRVRIESDRNQVLHLRGPAADPDGSQQKLKFVAIQETD